jgi:hypothetical protein
VRVAGKVSTLGPGALRITRNCAYQSPLTYLLAIETMSYINCDGQDFISELGHRISLVTEDPRETSFPFQRISVTMQRFNNVCFTNSFGHVRDDSANQPKHTAPGAVLFVCSLVFNAFGN